MHSILDLIELEHSFKVKGLPSVEWLRRFLTMAGNYFQIYPDMNRTDLTYLDQPIDRNSNKAIEFWRFTSSKIYEENLDLYIQVKKKGVETDVNLTYCDIPVLRSEMAERLLNIGVKAQLISLQIQGSNHAWCILNLLEKYDCLDKRRTEQWDIWKAEDGLPSKVGEYRSVVGLKIDPSLIETPSKAFRVSKLGTMIVDKTVKEEIESWPDPGVMWEQRA